MTASRYLSGSFVLGKVMSGWNATVCFLLLLFFGSVQAQSFLIPSDTLNKQRRTLVYASEGVVLGGALIGLNQLWYKDYPRSGFHFKNDNSDWMQMDKAGHVYTAYHMGRMGAELLEWSGADKKEQLVYGSTLGFAFLTAVETFDGFSQEWGASWGDVVANASGTLLYVSQELLWKEQRITPKFSFHTTRYAAMRPDVLGKDLKEQLLKDYNGQTYWLSANIEAFTKTELLPEWLSFAVGYSAEGMLSGRAETLPPEFASESRRYRQILFSLDIDFKKIKTKSPVLKTVFSILNTVKIPAPALELSDFSRLRGHWLYF